MIDELAVAARIAGWSRVYRMVTCDAATVLRLSDGEGEVRDGGSADLLLLRDCGQTPADALHGLSPEMVIVGGELKLIAPHAAARAPDAIEGAWDRVEVEGRGRYLAATAIPPRGFDLRLAGRRVA
jgi:hypothetical protein